VPSRSTEANANPFHWIDCDLVSRIRVEQCRVPGRPAVLKKADTAVLQRGFYTVVVAWVNETPDPNKCGSATFGVAKRLDTSAASAHVQSPRSSGHPVGSTTVSHAANMNGAVLKFADT
jgi:hypothetical protein